MRIWRRAQEARSHDTTGRVIAQTSSGPVEVEFFDKTGDFAEITLFGDEGWESGRTLVEPGRRSLAQGIAALGVPEGEATEVAARVQAEWRQSDT